MNSGFFFDNTTTLITGGTGSFGNAIVNYLLSVSKTARVIVYSRDEYKQYLMKQRFPDAVSQNKLSFVIGDVRNRDKLVSSCKNVDYIFHAAALKQVPTCEENIEETVLTNIIGAINVKYAAEICHVKKVVAISTDKAVQPVNLYGATKMVSDKIFTEVKCGAETICCIVRYGNVAASRGSVIPLFEGIRDEGRHLYPVTEHNMTRFWISLSDAVMLAITAIQKSIGGETFVAKIPSFRITDLVTAIDPNGETVAVGIRPGEKIHELMITQYDSSKTVDCGRYFIIFPTVEASKNSGDALVPTVFEYSSIANSQWLTIEDIRERLNELGRKSESAY